MHLCACYITQSQPWKVYCSIFFDELISKNITHEKKIIRKRWKESRLKIKLLK